MTIVEQREQQRPQQPDPRIAQASHDRAREYGNRTIRIADIAEETLAESERERGGRTRYEDAFQVLSWLVGAPWDERTVDVDRVLHDENGSLDVDKVTEFIDLILSGRSSLEARHVMLRRPAVLADEVRQAAEAAREVAAFHHRFADGPEQPQVHEAQAATRPALPSGGVPTQRNGVPLPHRQAPIAPAQPPEFEPAPEPTRAETTSEIMAVLRDETAGGAEKVLSPESIRKLQDEGFGPPRPQPGPAYGTAVPAGFGAASLPQVRAGDTRRFPAIPADGRPLAADGPVEGAAESLPFSTAAGSAALESPSGSVAAVSGSAADDDD